MVIECKKKGVGGRKGVDICSNVYILWDYSLEEKIFGSERAKFRIYYFQSCSISLHLVEISDLLARNRRC